MSLQAFQRLQTAMVLDKNEAARVAAGDFGVLGADLTALERTRLVSQARDPGMTLTRKLHKGWRLTKLLTLLPLTFRVGDPDSLADLVEEFWCANLPHGLYFEGEAARFAIFLIKRTPEGALLCDTAAFEGAMLAIGHRAEARPGSSLLVHLNHHPQSFLTETGEPAASEAFDVAMVASTEGPRIQVTRCSGCCDLGGRERTVDVLERALT